MVRRTRSALAVVTVWLACLCMGFFAVNVAFADENQPIADGIYTMGTAGDPNEVADVVAASEEDGANVTLWETYGAQNQKFQFDYLGDGLYKITALHSGQVLDVVASGTEEGTNVTQWPYAATDNQLWSVEDLGNETYRFKNQCNGLYLAIAGAAESSTNIVVSGATDDTTAWKLSCLTLAGTQTIEDGVYELSTSANDGLAVGIDSSSLVEGANAYLSESLGLASQKVRLTYQDDGTYLMELVFSEQVLDVVASGMRSGTNVTQWESLDTSNQRWVVIDNGDGTYRFVSKCNGMTLSSAVAGSAPSNLYVGVWTNDSLQHFTLTSAQTVKNGTYCLHLKDDYNFVVDICAGSHDDAANATLWTANSNDWQCFRVKYLDNGYYRITCAESNKPLDVVASGRYPGTNVTQWSDTGADNQQWSISMNEDGSFRIVSRCNDLPLCAEEASDGGNVIVGNQYETALSTWNLESVDERLDGFYTINLVADTNYVLDVVAGSTAEGANVTLWSSTGVNWQKFRFDYVGDGYYKIINCNSGQALDVVASGQTSPTNVTQWSYWGTDNQLWSLEGDLENGFYIKSKCNGLYLTADTGSESAEGANVYVSSAGNMAAQTFKLVPATAQSIEYKQYSFTLNQLLEWQRLSSYSTYSDEDGLYYLDPTTFNSASDEFYRFADLRGYSGLTADQLNAYISSTASGTAGTMAGMGQAFVDAAQSAQINESLVLSIAVLESGWGTSWLSSGVYYDGTGFTAEVWDEDTGVYTTEWVDYPGYEPGTYYNFFGIGAYDTDPMRGGMKKAIEQGWNSVETAIEGGAQWIADNYVYADEYPQETLYEIRWDIDRSEATQTRGYHQYCTSLTWDSYLASTFMAKIYQSAGVETPSLSYIVPKYL